MKTKQWMVSLMVAALFGTVAAWAEDTKTGTVTNAVEHPEQAYHEHEVKADQVDSQVYAQQMTEAKARMDQAKTDYEKSLSANGANSDVTKQAKKRFADARKEYKKLAKKTSGANKELKEDAQELRKDKAVQ